MILLVLVLLCPAARGAELEEAVGMEELRQAAGGYLSGYLKVEELTGESFSSGLGAVLEGGRPAAAGAIRRAGKSGVLLLSVAIFCSLWDGAGSGLSGGGLDPVRLAGTAAVTAVAVADVEALMGLGREALGQLESFSGALLPVMTAVGAASGRAGTALARQGAALLFLNLVMVLARRLILPLVYGYVCASAGRCALGNEGLGRVASVLKWTAGTLLSALLTAFVFYLTVTSSVAGSADALAQKAAKTVLSGMIPVVGGILSDAAGTVAAGAGVLRGTVGVMGLLCVLAICLGPFLHLGCHYLVYRLCAALAATVCPGPVSGLIDAIGGAFALVMGMVGSAGVILYVALLVSMGAASLF